MNISKSAADEENVAQYIPQCSLFLCIPFLCHHGFGNASRLKSELCLYSCLLYKKGRFKRVLQVEEQGYER